MVTQGLTKRFGEILAVDSLDLEISRGEIYGLLGPNGAGKTTALRLLLGLLRPTAGSASVLGRSPGQPEALGRIGAMVEEPAAYPYLSGRDHLRVLARAAGADRDRVDPALETVGLLSRADDRVRTYSLGMRQRLGVAAALMKNPELLILDEPTNGLDPAGISAMRDLVRTLGAQGRTILLSSHLLAEVEQVCDRVGVIRQGRLVADASVAELRGASALRVRAEPLDEAARLTRSFAGDEAVKVIDGHLQVVLADDRAAELNATLVSAGIRVSELGLTQRTLEDVFFALTDEPAQESSA